MVIVGSVDIGGSDTGGQQGTKALHDCRGTAVRLTRERLAHILEHPEMREMEPAIARTLAKPENVIRSVSDEQTRLYYRVYSNTLVGEKLLCVVVKVLDQDAFILTAYLTDRVKRGEVLWSAAR